MTTYLAFSIGDKQSGITNVTLPGASGVNKLLSDPNILSHFFQNFFTFLIVLAILIAFAFVIFEGFRYMTSQGSKEELDKARTSLVNALVGLVIILTSFFIINLLGFFFHVHLLNTVFTIK